MARPAGNSAKKLLDAGTALALERGCGAVSVRETCRRAGVNLGLFYYNFKDRDSFIDRILEEGYKEFFSRLSLSAEGGGNPPERLRRAFGAITRFARERRRLMLGLLRDGMNGEKKVAAFVAKTFPHHLPLIFSIYEEGVKTGSFRPLPPPLFLSTCMGIINGPAVMLGLLEEHGADKPLGRNLARFEKELFSDEALETRLDMLLAALKAPGRAP